MSCTYCVLPATWELFVDLPFTVTLGTFKDGEPMVVEWDRDQQFPVCDACRELFLAGDVEALVDISVETFAAHMPQHATPVKLEVVRANAKIALEEVVRRLVGDGLELKEEDHVE